jgi:hypothetical protein
MFLCMLIIPFLDDDGVRSSTSLNSVGLHGLLLGKLYVLYLDDIHTAQETHLWASTALYWGSFTSLYVDDVRTSQETNLFTSTAC